MKYKKLATIAIILIIIINNAYTQNKKHEVNWYTIEQVQSLSKNSPRAILIDVYTEWCTWCKVMDKKTWTNPVIADYVNNNFYAVKFDAESLDTVIFKDYTFINENKTRRSTHQFAIAILNENLSYPSIAYLDKDLQLVTVIPGYQKPEDIEPILVFINEEKYKTTTYEKFFKEFKSKL